MSEGDWSVLVKFCVVGLFVVSILGVMVVRVNSVVKMSVVISD